MWDFFHLDRIYAAWLWWLVQMFKLTILLSFGNLKTVCKAHRIAESQFLVLSLIGSNHCDFARLLNIIPDLLHQFWIGEFHFRFHKGDIINCIHQEWVMNRSRWSLITKSSNYSQPADSPRRDTLALSIVNQGKKCFSFGYLDHRNCSQTDFGMSEEETEDLHRDLLSHN